MAGKYYKPFTDEEWAEGRALSKWRRKEGAITGVRVLGVAVGSYKDPSGVSMGVSIENYELLLKNTFGERNVTFIGVGYQRRFNLGPMAYEGEDFTGRKHLTQEEFEELIDFEKYMENTFGGAKYSQIHIISHGDAESPDPKKAGLLFLGGFEDDEKKIPQKDIEGKINRVGFNPDKATKINDRNWWPIATGGKLLLLGCNTAFGVFPNFLSACLPDCEIHSMTGPFQCWCLEARDGSKSAMDWYSEYQHESVKNIAANWLHIEEPPNEIPEKFYEE
jgi:hypothetical protein